MPRRRRIGPLAAAFQAAAFHDFMIEFAPTCREMHTDVLVIGCGAAGATAAMTARAAGAEVLVIDSAPYRHRGGNSRVCGQIVFWPDDVAQVEAYFRAMAGPYMDHISDALVSTLAMGMHANRAWLEGLGMQVEEVQSVEYPDLPGSGCVHVLLHRKGPYGQARLWDEVIEPAFARAGLAVTHDTRATRLEKTGDAVSGVLALGPDGPVRIHSRRAVVLACGGFENDHSMVRTYLTDMPLCHPLGTPYNTGDGIRMAMQAGAELWHMNNIAGPFLAFKAPELPVSARLGALRAHSYLYVAGDAKRFVSESANFLVRNGRQLSPIKHGKILQNGRYVQYPCPAPMFIVFDETVRRAGALCSRAAGFEFCWDVIQGDLYQWSADNSREVGRGWILRGDSIADIAGQIGLEAATLTDTVARFNALCAAGIDTEWQRPAATLAPLAQPPYYAMPLTPSMLNTQGGPVHNEHAQVIGVDGRPIPRLYAAGELGSIYSYRYQAGANLGECFAFGRIAGNRAAAEPPLQG
jgi:succinate dehydrogenase/fumarate reductase flavoprotein subunit